MRTFSLFILVVSGLLAGCSGTNEGDTADEGEESEGALGNTTTLTFAADGAVTQSGPITQGGRVRVKYTPSRLPGCRGEMNGKPAWTITGFASLNGKDPVTFDTAKVGSVPVATAGDLALWFQVTNRWGCSEFDSKHGKNYHFEVKGTNLPVGASIVFDKEGTVTQKGNLVAGGKVSVLFAQDRLPKCRGSQSGIPQWNISGFASVNGAKPTTFMTSQPDSKGNRTDVAATVELPESGDLALWFQSTNRYGCNEYDSKSGANYHFQVR